MDNEQRHEDFAGVELRVLRRPMYHNDPLWPDLLKYRVPVARHLAQIGLELRIDEDDGFAYVRQKDGEEADSLPRLILRRAMSFEVSLFCVVLREEWGKDQLSFDGGDRYYRSESDLSVLLSILLPDMFDETKKENQFNGLLQKGRELGLLRELPQPGADGKRVFELMPIIKALVTPDFVEEFKRVLEQRKDNNDA